MRVPSAYSRCVVAPRRDAPLRDVRVLLVATDAAPVLTAEHLAALGAAVVVRGGVGTRAASGLEGAPTLSDLVRDADVLLVDGPATTRGPLVYEETVTLNPRLIVCAVTPYGDTGPMAGFTGGETTVQSLTGVRRADATATVVEAPRIAWAAELAAARAVGEIASALLARERDGAGARLDVALVDPLVDVIDRALDPGEPFALVGVFPTGDGRFIALEVPDLRWSAFCEALGLFDVRSLSRFERMSRAGELAGKVATTLGREPCAPMLQRLLAAGVAATPALARADALAVPHLQSRRSGRVMTDATRAPGFPTDRFPSRADRV